MKNKLIIILFSTYILFFSISHIILRDKDISEVERRKLAKLPDIKEITKGEYSNKLESYLLDHFPFRNNFRSIKALYNYKILNKYDNNNIYLKDNYIFKSEYPTNKKSISNFIDKTNSIKEKLTNKNRTYIMIVPDKNFYLKDKNFLHIDYGYIKDELSKLNMTTINIDSVLTLNDYYETDTHWKQENLNKVVKEMSHFMNFKYKETKYIKNTYDKFYGVYYGESAINREPEIITYLTNETLNKVEVKYLENQKLNNIYNIDKLTSFDSYEVYLDGASSYIEITNPNSTSKKELIIFRDSFGSSLTPLLVEYYSKITLIDNRYINSIYLDELIEITNQDVLFMYSTLFINNSFTLKG